MDKQEYLMILEKSLVGKIDPDVLRETMDYYADYFYMEGSKGKAESDIIESLGEPRFLAKSIIAAQGASNKKHEVVNDDMEFEKKTYRKKNINIPFPIIILIAIFILFGVIGLIFSIASALLPILLPVLIVYGIISFFKKNR